MSGPMETGPNAGAGPGGPEPDEDDLVDDAPDPESVSPGAFLTDPMEDSPEPTTIGETDVVRTGVGGPGEGGLTTRDLDAGRGREGLGADLQPGADD